MSIGYQKALVGRVVLVLLGVGFVVIAAWLGGWFLGTLAVQVIASDPDSPGPLIFLPIVMTGAFGGLTTYWLARLVGKLFQAAWLQGTLLTVRDFRVFAVDLATARRVRVQPSSVPLAAPASVGVGGLPLMVPLLIVNSNGPELRLRLASRERVLLPPEQLVLLANALSATRCAGAAETIGWLRAMAAWPR